MLRGFSLSSIPHFHRYAFCARMRHRSRRQDPLFTSYVIFHLMDRSVIVAPSLAVLFWAFVFDPLLVDAVRVTTTIRLFNWPTAPRWDTYGANPIDGAPSRPSESSPPSLRLVGFPFPAFPTSAWTAHLPRLYADLSQSPCDCSVYSSDLSPIWSLPYVGRQQIPNGVARLMGLFGFGNRGPSPYPPTANSIPNLIEPSNRALFATIPHPRYRRFDHVWRIDTGPCGGHAHCKGDEAEECFDASVNGHNGMSMIPVSVLSCGGWGAKRPRQFYHTTSHLCEYIALCHC